MHVHAWSQPVFVFTNEPKAFAFETLDAAVERLGIEAEDIRAGKYAALFTVDGTPIQVTASATGHDIEFTYQRTRDEQDLRRRLADVCARLGLHSSPDDPAGVAAELAPLSRPRLRFRSEVGGRASPLWTTRGRMVELDGLPLSPALAGELAKWADVAWGSDDPDLRAKGMQLCQLCADALKEHYEVDWDDD
jgi:hypothetical protein